MLGSADRVTVSNNAKLRMRGCEAGTADGGCAAAITKFAVDVVAKMTKAVNSR